MSSSVPKPTAAELKRQKAREALIKWRANRSEEKKAEDRAKDAQRNAPRMAAVRANETRE